MKTFAFILGQLWVTSPAWAQPEAPSSLTIDEEILVTADFRQAKLFDLGVSATVIDAETINQRDATHLEQVLNLAPNVNFASGASRGRFFQIRGIGERSQFVEPMNASVGLIVDGIDMTGIGGAATTLDIQQVEVLRGPQGTLFGANALAGMINMVSGNPTGTFSGKLQGSVGEHDTRSFEALASGPMTETLGYRLAYSNYQSDGFQKNAFLDTDDTADFDEQTLRAKLRWEPGKDWLLDLTGLYVDIDNGYDGFSLDNTRTTFSDQPGHDRQETLAGSAQITWRAHQAFDVEALVSRTDADLEYGFDEDWSFEGFCEAFECLASSFSSFDNYIRDNENTTTDLRLVSNTDADEMGWVLGAYYRDQTQELRRVYTFLEDDFVRDYDTQNTALYGQLDIPLAERLKLTTGLRYEEREADYADSDGAAFEPDEDMWGGKLALEYRAPGGGLWYALASRGYKAGGVNSDSAVPDAQREFDTETMWNYELGVKTSLWNNRLNLQANLFFQDRDDVQTGQSLVQPFEGEDCPCQFIDFTTNATAGQSYGLETELNWQVNNFTQAFASLGLLGSQFDDFLNFSHVDANPETGEPVDMDGRELPQAPNYQFALGAVFQLTEHWYTRLEMEGKDDFFYSSRHEVKSDAYELFHARIGYRAERWDLALWARNITDEDVKVRGFGSFGNDPRKGFAVEPFHQFGEPRFVGVTASYRF